MVRVGVDPAHDLPPVGVEYPEEAFVVDALAAVAAALLLGNDQCADLVAVDAGVPGQNAQGLHVSVGVGVGEGDELVDQLLGDLERLQDEGGTQQFRHVLFGESLRAGIQQVSHVGHLLTQEEQVAAVGRELG